MAPPKAKSLVPTKVHIIDDVRWRTKFLQTLLKTEGDIDAAAAAAGIAPIIAYQARRRDPDFEADWAEVKDIVKERRADKIEDTMVVGATAGHTHTAAMPGIGAVDVQDAPDTRAGEFLLKGYRPMVFREKPPSAGLSEFQTLAELFRAVETAKREALAKEEPLPALPAATLIEVKAE